MMAMVEGTSIDLTDVIPGPEDLPTLDSDSVNIETPEER